MLWEFEFTEEKMQECLKRNKEINEWFPLAYEAMERYELTTLNRAAGFLAQTAHESADWTITRENLNYRAESLLRVFPKYFKNLATAQDYAKRANKQEAIANRIYASRMGNGDEASGDGWRFRGRGIIQLTGHNNYAACSQAVFEDDRLLNDPDWLESREGCIAGACWFWTANGLNTHCDNNDIVTMSKRINGGTIGLEDRKKHYELFKEILA